MKIFQKILFAILILVLNTEIIAQQTSVTYTAGSGNFVVPCGVTSVTVECWGGGGGGAGDGTAGGGTGSGGGAGGYSMTVLAVSPGVSLPYVVGTGGAGGSGNANGVAGGNTTFSTVTANGGGGGAFNSGAGGVGGTGTTSNGTDGLIGGAANGGNGGSSTNGGSGGSGGASNANGAPGLVAGGGGGGGGQRTGGANNGGAGARGEIIVTYTVTSAGIDQTLSSCATTTSLNATAPSAGTGTWTCVSGCTGVGISSPNSPTSAITGLVPGTPTTFAWTVSNGGCTSTVDQVVVNPPTGPGCWVYCTPTQDGNYPITNVTFGTINNSNTGLGVPYQNFNNLCTSVTQGQTYNISVTSTGLSPNVFNTAVYFDWNNDGDYSDAGEFYDIGGNGTSPHTLNLNIVIPSTATLGTTSMLVYNQYNVDAAPCQAGPANGQAESYCVTINFAPGTCSDGILNNAETQIDCGGPNCAPCPPTCSDGIQNQGEDDVDCGGPCPACAFTQPTTGINGTYVGSCMVNACTGIYTDDNNGGGGFYSNSVNGIYRVFCPDVPGNCMRLSFTSIDLANQNCLPGMVPCDVLTIGDGATQNSTAIGTITYLNDGTTPVFTANNPSGCLSLRFSSSSTGNAAGWSANITCVPCAATAGLPQTNDCVNSTGVCSNATINDVSTGPGINSESCSSGSCTAGGENYALWYDIQISASGTLGFTIDPTQGNDDYDFALYGPNVTCGSIGSPVRCSYSAALNNTGMGNGASDASENVSGDGWVSLLNVTAGQTYLLMVNHWTPLAANQGFSLNWNLGGGASLDCAVLPIDLLSFTGYYSKDGVVLNWETSTETNNDFFTVERSVDAKNFEGIINVKGAGNSNQLNRYFEIDRSPFKGVSYYRLKQTDFDGRVDFSRMITVESFNNDFKIVPNPSASNEGFVIQDLFSQENVNVVITDLAGKIVFNKEFHNESGDIEVKHNLSSGIYLIKVITNQNVVSQKLIIE